MNCKVLLLILHDSISITRDIVEDIEFFLMNKRSDYADKDICFLLHTTGGDADAAYHIGARLQDFVGGHKLYVVVPRLAKSAGTLLACAGNSIYVTPITELGPVDPQIYIEETKRWVSARAVQGSLKQVLETLLDLWGGREERRISVEIVEALLKRIPIVELGHYDSLVKHIEDLLKSLLSKRMFKDEPADKINSVVKKLTEGYEYHGRVINYNEAIDIGLKVELLSDEKLKKVYELYRVVKELFRIVDDMIMPMINALYALNIALPIEGYELHHGLLYLPSLLEEKYKTSNI